jgi:putative sugar O-methyltransferase
MSLTDAQKALFVHAAAENAQAGFPFAPTEFWQKETHNFEQEFREKGVETFLESQYNTRFHGIQKNDFRLYGWFLNTFYNLLKKRDSLGLLDRIDRGVSEADVTARHEAWSKTDKGTPIRVEGKLVYADLLFSIHDFYNLYELCPAVATEPVVVGDVGAGWGRIGHVLIQANPQATYLVLDIPGSLVISSTTLPALLPQANIKMYHDSRGTDEITRERLTQSAIWILGSHDLRRVQRGAIDILVNVASFQEMPTHQVNAYLEIFNQVIERGYVYLRNNAFSKFGLAGPNDYRIPPRWRKTFIRLTPFSENIFEAGFALE